MASHSEKTCDLLGNDDKIALLVDCQNQKIKIASPKRDALPSRRLQYEIEGRPLVCYEYAQ